MAKDPRRRGRAAARPPMRRGGFRQGRIRRRRRVWAGGEDMSGHYDLIVIGAGPAGEKGAAQAAYFGKSVCIIERAPKPGGAAVNTGTIPSKALRETALYFSGLRQRGLYGVDFQVKRNITISDFMFRERAVIEAQWKLIDENLK